VAVVPSPVAGSFPHGSDPASNPPRHAGSCMSLRILIVDDSASIRNLLRLFIEHNTDWQVCGEADNGQIAVEKVTELKPHAVILDLSMPVMNGLDAAREITRIAPKIQIVMFTMHVTEQLRKDAQSVGIKDVISKSETIGDHLLPSLRTLCARWYPAA
jgi:two-component system chemotaxis response regulator CheY